MQRYLGPPGPWARCHSYIIRIPVSEGNWKSGEK